MDNDGAPHKVDLHPVTKIITSYLGNHALAPDQLSTLIVAVQQAIHQLGKPVQPEAMRMPAATRRPAVSTGRCRPPPSVAGNAHYGRDRHGPRVPSAGRSCHG